MAHQLNIEVEAMTYSQLKRWICKINSETQKENYHYKEKRINEYIEQRKPPLQEARGQGTKNNRKRQTTITQYLKNY